MFRNLLLSAALALAPAAAVLADPMTRGRALAEAFLRGDPAEVWAAMTPEMQAAIGSAEALSALREQAAEFGSEDKVLSETVTQAQGHEVYERLARWTEGTVPLHMVIALDGEARIAGFYLRPQPQAAPSDRLDYHTKAPLRLPFEGTWDVVWGGRSIEQNYHAIDRAQRFALDLLVREAGVSHTGNPQDLTAYHCWDRPILSPGAGVVVQAVGDLPDQPIGSSDPANPAGNHVVIDFGAGEYGLLAHLRAGSLQVAEGDTVAPGDEVGRCGNSGNTTEPHLHFHLQTSPDLNESEGLPAQFLDYIADGKPVARGEPERGQSVRPAP